MYYNKIRELLCSEESVRGDLMELRIGTMLRYRNTDYSLGVNFRWYLSYSYTATTTWDLDYFNEKKGVDIIGNDIELRHILLYINERNTKIDCWSTLTIESDGEVRYEGNTICTLDNKKTIKDQDESTLEKLYNFLK